MEPLIARLVFLWCSHYSKISEWRNHSPLLETLMTQEGEDSDNIGDSSCESEFDCLARIDYSVDPPSNPLVAAVLPQPQDNIKSGGMDSRKMQK